MSDANFAAHVEDQKSVSGWSVFLNSARWEKSCQQNCVTLSVTEAELIMHSRHDSDHANCDMFGIEREDNRDVVDLVNKWSVSGQTRHVDVRFWWLRNLKEEGQLIVEWIDTEKYL